MLKKYFFIILFFMMQMANATYKIKIKNHLDHCFDINFMDSVSQKEKRRKDLVVFIPLIDHQLQKIDQKQASDFLQGDFLTKIFLELDQLFASGIDMQKLLNTLNEHLETLLGVTPCEVFLNAEKYHSTFIIEGSVLQYLRWFPNYKIVHESDFYEEMVMLTNYPHETTVAIMFRFYDRLKERDLAQSARLVYPYLMRDILSKDINFMNGFAEQIAGIFTYYYFLYLDQCLSNSRLSKILGLILPLNDIAELTSHEFFLEQWFVDSLAKENCIFLTDQLHKLVKKEHLFARYILHLTLETIFRNKLKLSPQSSINFLRLTASIIYPSYHRRSSAVIPKKDPVFVAMIEEPHIKQCMDLSDDWQGVSLDFLDNKDKKTIITEELFERGETAQPLAISWQQLSEIEDKNTHSPLQYSKPMQPRVDKKGLFKKQQREEKKKEIPLQVDAIVLEQEWHEFVQNINQLKNIENYIYYLENLSLPLQQRGEGYIQMLKKSCQERFKPPSKKNRKKYTARQPLTPECEFSYSQRHQTKKATSKKDTNPKRSRIIKEDRKKDTAAPIAKTNEPPLKSPSIKKQTPEKQTDIPDSGSNDLSLQNNLGNQVNKMHPPKENSHSKHTRTLQKKREGTPVTASKNRKHPMLEEPDIGEKTGGTTDIPYPPNAEGIYQGKNNKNISLKNVEHESESETSHLSNMADNGESSQATSKIIEEDTHLLPLGKKTLEQSTPEKKKKKKKKKRKKRKKGRK